MRCEQILKIFIDQAVTPDLTLTSNSERSWMWAFTYYADGEASTDPLILRFRYAAEAKNFMTAVDEAKYSLNKEDAQHRKDE